ncbi:MAG: hypothetical protein M3Q17_03160, partial [Actinomycetota bacterium]|nr:hypothetical protein [Actinomycetota bacterium]
MGGSRPRLGAPALRSRLDATVARARLMVRRATTDVPPGALALVACSGGADSLALLVAARFEGNRAGWGCGAVVVDHQLQAGSAAVAQRAAALVRDLGADPVEVVAVAVVRRGGP